MHFALKIRSLQFPSFAQAEREITHYVTKSKRSDFWFAPPPAPGQDCFKQFPTPGPKVLDLSWGLPRRGMVTGQIEPCIMIKIKWNWACLNVCGKKGPLPVYECEIAQESICSCRLPLQRLPLYTTATHLCPRFMVVVAGSCNLGIRPSLGWRKVRRERSFSPFTVSPFCFSLSQPFLSHHATSACKARALHDETKTVAWENIIRMKFFRVKIFTM